MSDDPKKLEGIDTPRGKDEWGVGQMTDGTIDVIPEDKIAESFARRDADEAAFGAMLAGIDDDDMSDLDDDYGFAEGDK